MKVALVIPVHNRRDTTLQGLRSLSRIDKEGLEVKIFVVDDGSTDGTGDAVRDQFPEVTLIRGDGTLHYAAGTNRGIEQALKWGPEFIVTMNDDAVFHEQFLQRLVSTARNNEHSIVGSLLLLWDEPHRVFQVAPSWNTWAGGWVIPEDLTGFSVPKEAFDVEVIVGNCVLFPVEAVRQCGLMNEKSFPHGWGDAQYLMTMRKAGWKLLVEPKSLVWCEPNTYPKPLHQLPIRECLRALFVNKRHPLNLNRQFVARWHSAPTRPRAVAAFGAYGVILLKKSVAYGLKRIFRKQSQINLGIPK